MFKVGRERIEGEERGLDNHINVNCCWESHQPNQRYDAQTFSIEGQRPCWDCWRFKRICQHHYKRCLRHRTRQFSMGAKNLSILKKNKEMFQADTVSKNEIEKKMYSYVRQRQILSLLLSFYECTQYLIIMFFHYHFSFCFTGKIKRNFF